MRLTNIFILVFLLSAFAIGINYQDNNVLLLENSLDNASRVIQNFTLESQGSQYLDGMFSVVEKFIHFVGVSFVEITRLGILFGTENPHYFEAEFILELAKFIILVVIVSLLIKPMVFLIGLVIMLLLWVKEKLFKIKKERLRDEKAI